MVKTSLTLFFTCIAIFKGRIGFILAIDECYTNGDCYSNFRHLRIVCCKNSRDSDRICQPYNCQGRYCFTDGDCGGEGECCMNNKCIHSQNCSRCKTSSDCAASEYCCKRAHGNVCRRSCVRERCEKGGDQCAGPGEYCDPNNACAKLLNPIKTSRKTPKQTLNQTPAPKQKSESFTCSCSDTFSDWATGFIVIGILLTIIGAITSYLLYHRCISENSRRNSNTPCTGIINPNQDTATWQPSTNFATFPHNSHHTQQPHPSENLSPTVLPSGGYNQAGQFLQTGSTDRSVF